jgi:hypothetical protein
MYISIYILLYDLSKPFASYWPHQIRLPEEVQQKHIDVLLISTLVSLGFSLYQHAEPPHRAFLVVLCPERRRPGWRWWQVAREFIRSTHHPANSRCPTTNKSADISGQWGSGV